MSDWKVLWWTPVLPRWHSARKYTPRAPSCSHHSKNFRAETCHTLTGIAGSSHCPGSWTSAAPEQGRYKGCTSTPGPWRIFRSRSRQRCILQRGAFVICKLVLQTQGSPRVDLQIGHSLFCNDSREGILQCWNEIGIIRTDRYHARPAHYAHYRLL